MASSAVRIPEIQVEFEKKPAGIHPNITGRFFTVWPCSYIRIDTAATAARIAGAGYILFFQYVAPLNSISN